VDHTRVVVEDSTEVISCEEEIFLKTNDRVHVLKTETFFRLKLGDDFVQSDLIE